MTPKITKLFFWHLIFFLLFYEFRETLESRSFKELLSWFEFKDGLLNLSALFIFYCYSLGAYLILFNLYPGSIYKVVFSLPGVVVLVIGVRYFIEEVIFLAVFGFDNYYGQISWLNYGLSNLFYAILHLGIGCVFFFVQYSSYKETQEQKLLIENKKTELAYLKAQVNPHFLFNTLNNIYSLIYQKSENALPAVEKLTSLLRYGLYEGEEQIALEKEISNIQNFIVLEQYRYAYPLNIDLIVEGDITKTLIPPFILIPFVENAFKHGDLKSALRITIKVLNQKLTFTVWNQIKAKNKDDQGGIGLENIKKRLQLIYGQKHFLAIDQNTSSYYVCLEINS